MDSVCYLDFNIWNLFGIWFLGFWIWVGRRREGVRLVISSYYLWAIDTQVDSYILVANRDARSAIGANIGIDGS